MVKKKGKVKSSVKSKKSAKKKQAKPSHKSSKKIPVKKQKGKATHPKESKLPLPSHNQSGVEDTKPARRKVLDTYEFISDEIPITITVYLTDNEFVPIYDVSISSISETTSIILEKIRQELTTQVSLGMVDILDSKKSGIIEQSFVKAIVDLLRKYFPNIDERTLSFLKSYLVQKSLGLGSIEILMDDTSLEEIAINGGGKPVWVYHKKHGWAKTTIIMESDEQVLRYSTMIGRKVGRQITILEPLMDATIGTGNRVNSTLMPISVDGNTITLRKFASKPWTITDLLRTGTISPPAASLVWLGIQYELSMLIAGGTASGKTSMLNSVTNFFPPNQRVLSIEDTREVQLPSFCHWIPMLTRLPNPEGKGEVSMLHLLVNALRQRPDRIVVGEIRRKKEAEVLFEAIHTGHSVYATVHANDAHETVNRLTNKPIEIPKTMLPAISMVVVQYRNRRTGNRNTFQLAEITEDAQANVLMQFDAKKEVLRTKNASKSFMKTIELFTGLSKKDISKELKEKEKILKWLAHFNVNTVNKVGTIIAEYYTNKDNLMKYVNKNREFTGQR